MALIPCPECGKEISSYARACPGCGYPFTERKKELDAIVKKSTWKNIGSRYEATIYFSDGKIRVCKPESNLDFVRFAKADAFMNVINIRDSLVGIENVRITFTKYDNMRLDYISKVRDEELENLRYESFTRIE